jgi:hypothetical protein
MALSPPLSICTVRIRASEAGTGRKMGSGKGNALETGVGNAEASTY